MPSGITSPICYISQKIASTSLNLQKFQNFPVFEVNFPCKNIFLMVFAKFPVLPLSLSGKMSIQIPFSLIYVDVTKLDIKASHKNIYDRRNDDLGKLKNKFKVSFKQVSFSSVPIPDDWTRRLCRFCMGISFVFPSQAHVDRRMTGIWCTRRLLTWRKIPAA